MRFQAEYFNNTATAFVKRKRALITLLLLNTRRLLAVYARQYSGKYLLHNTISVNEQFDASLSAKADEG